MHSLHRYIPGHTQTIKFKWCKRSFTKMSERYRMASPSAGMRECFWCKHKFIDGEQMALAQPETGQNRTLCQACADQLLRSPEHEHK